MEMKELFQLSFRCTKLKCGVHLGFCGNVRPAACCAPCEKPSRGVWAGGRVTDFSRVGGVLCSWGGARVAVSVG